MAGQIPLVDYLVLDEDHPHLVAQECVNCGVQVLRPTQRVCQVLCHRIRDRPDRDRGHGARVHHCAFAAPGIPTPFVAAVVDCGGTQVRANLINVEPDPEHVFDGMKVRLATHSIGTDSAGTEAVGFGFEPVSATKEQ